MENNNGNTQSKVSNGSKNHSSSGGSKGKWFTNSYDSELRDKEGHLIRSIHYKWKVFVPNR